MPGGVDGPMNIDVKGLIPEFGGGPSGGEEDCGSSVVRCPRAPGKYPVRVSIMTDPR